MTIFEMLEKLETEIVSLRAQCRDLAGSQGHPQSNGTGRRDAATGTGRDGAMAKRPAARKSKTGKPGKGKKRQTGTGVKTRTAKQLELSVPENPPIEGQPERILGKRQALGKSLVQLRKMSSWRAGRDAAE